MRSRLWVVVLACLMIPASARAFCGFYVASGDARIFNEATTVVLLRSGTTTVLSMQNDYRGPPEDFAMVVPVPTVLHEEDVKTLDRALFDRVDRLASPRLVEYWEEDPCIGEGTIGLGNLGTIGHGGGGGTGSGYGRGAAPLVTVEAEFAVGEYDIVILSARESGALDAWLREHDYRIPDGAAEVLRPYVEGDMKFFVARVDPERVTFAEGRAVLSPLRVHYESEQLTLPVRLGLLSSSGTQDLIVHVLSPHQRYELANYENVTIPTNLDVRDEVRDRFGEFYAALFDATVERHPGAVVTEYAWGATGCDPCPGPTLTPSDIASLGADVTHPGAQAPGSGGFAGRRGSVPQIRTGEARVRGSLSREIIRRVVRRHINEVRFCYEQQLNTSPSLAGRVEIDFTISPTGAVSEASVAATTLASPAAESCIANAVRRWTFPSPQGGGVVQVRYPFIMSSTSGFVGGFFGGGPFSDFVLTRLHYRYGRESLGEDLVFRAADPIVGGREERDERGELEHGAQPSVFGGNTFQARYAIRHAWEGPIECEQPIRGRWGAPPDGREPPDPAAARNVAQAPRGGVALGSLLLAAVPEAGVDAVTPPTEAPEPATAEATETPTAEEAADVAPSGACGCRVVPRSGAPLGLALLALLLVPMRRR